MTQYNHISGLVAALLVSSLVVAGGIGLAPDWAAAQTGEADENVGVEKNVSEGQLVVTVPQSEAPFDQGNATVKITVQAGGTTKSINQTSTPVGETFRYAVSLIEFTGTFETLEGANVTVSSVANGTPKNLSSKRMDLRWVKIDSAGADATFRSLYGTDGWQLEVPLQTTVGVADGATVQTEVNGTSITGTVRTGRSPTLTLSRQALVDAGVLDEPDAVSIAAVSEPDGNAVAGTGTANLSLRTASKTVVRADGKEVHVENPLLIEGRVYDVKLETGGAAQGVYTSPVEAGAATVTVTQPALASADTLTVHINRSGSVVVSETNTDVGKTVYAADLTSDGTTVVVEGISTTEVTALWAQRMNNESSLERFDVTTQANESGTQLEIEDDETLNATTDYAFLMLFSDGSQAVARTDVETARRSPGSQPGDAQSNEGQSEGPLTGLFSTDVPLWIVVTLVGIVLAGGVAFMILESDVLSAIDLGASSDSGRTQSGGGGSSAGNLASGRGAGGATLTVTATDGATGKPFPGTPTVVARYRSQSSSRFRGGRQPNRTGGGQAGGSRGQAGGGGQNARRSGRMSDGSVRFEGVKPGTLTVELLAGQRKIASKNVRVNEQDEHVAFTVSPHAVQVKVVDGATEEPLSGAVVTLREDTGEERTKRTEADGIVRHQVSRAAHNPEVSVSHDGYRSWRSTIQTSDSTQSRRMEGRVELEHEHGSISIETSAGGRPLPGVAVTVQPADSTTAKRTDERRVETGEDGSVSVSELPIGSYLVQVEADQSMVEQAGDPREVTVDPEATPSVTVPVEVPFSLSAEQRHRVDELHERVEHMTSVTDRDVAIQHYFGTVITAVLESVEAVEQHAALCYIYRVPPDSVADALLDGVEDVLSAVESSMKVTRNVKLFRACADYEPVEARWSGEVELETYLKRLDNGAPAQRRELRNQLQELDEFLDERWGEVGELGPARETYDRIVERVQSAEAGDEKTEVAQVYVALCMVEAIENLFDHDELVKRLNTTVY